MPVTATDDAEAIRCLIAEYGRLLDARDAPAWAALFTTDGEWVGGERYGKIAGREALARFVAREFAATPPSVHLVGSIAITVDAAEANAWSRWMLLEQAPGGIEITLAGSYDDRLRRTPEGWRFQRREVRVDLPQGA